MKLRLPSDMRISWEAFDPFSIYHFSRGLTLSIGAEKAYLYGGPRLCKVYDSPASQDPDMPAPAAAYEELVDKIETEIGVRPIAMVDRFPGGEAGDIEAQTTITDPSVTPPPERTVFRYGAGYVRDGILGEDLIGELRDLEYYCGMLLSGFPGGQLDTQTYGICACLKDEVWSGHLGPAAMEALVQQARAAGLPIERAFFCSNMAMLVDDARSAIGRACYHFRNMAEHLWSLNQHTDIHGSRLDSLFADTISNQHELVVQSEVADRVADEFTSATVACYSALDLLYELFVYLVREPFGQPAYPSGLHFPDQDPQRGFPAGSGRLPSDLASPDAPFAIPNLPAATFTPLRRLRSDLVHNMSADELRTKVYVGVALPPVREHKLQYSVYYTRDVDSAGRPITHPYVRRFYEQQRDAQHFLHDYLTQVWQCIFDTVHWLTNRLRDRALQSGLLVHGKA